MPIKPNILLIMSDQLIPMLTGAFGNEAALTPNIDRLAQRSVVFRNAYTSCPICAPARMGLMTGQYGSTIGCNDNSAFLASDEPCFGHYFTLAGYETVLSGKAHIVGPDQLHGYTERLTPNIYPADLTWLSTRDKSGTHSAMHEQPIAIDYVAKASGVRQWSMQLDYDEETHFRALEYLRRKRSIPSGTLQKPLPPRDDKPFLLHVSYQHPHEPFHCTQEHWDRYEGIDIPIPTMPSYMGPHRTSMDLSLNTFHGCEQVDLLDPDSLRAVHRAYYASMSYLDDKIGELLQALKDYGLTEDTIILFCSDHGDMLGARGMVQKRCFYEQSSRIMLMASFPENHNLHQPTRWVDDPVSIVDICPTLLDLVGVEPERILPMDGESLMPQLEGKSDPERTIYCENHVEGVTTTCFMARRGDYKYVYIHPNEEQLFDVAQDPEEWRNLAKDPVYTEVKANMREALMKRFDPDAIEVGIEANLRKRWLIKNARQLGNRPSWNYEPKFDADTRYWREG